MAEERVRRRLAAIMAADVAGYSRLMGEDEAGTHAALRTLRRELFDPQTKRFGGHVFKNTGDGALVEFPSAVDAVLSAIEVQRVLARRNADVPADRRIELRIGISLGDVIVDGDDLHGNGINVAARTEKLAELGGICVSDNVREHLKSVEEIDLQSGAEPDDLIVLRNRCRRRARLQEHPMNTHRIGDVLDLEGPQVLPIC